MMSFSFILNEFVQFIGESFNTQLRSQHIQEPKIR